MSLTIAPSSPFLATGDSAAFVHAPAEYTVAQAAEFLDVSEDCVVELLNFGVLEYRQDGGHRLINRDELFGYAQRRERNYKALEEIVRFSEEMGLYDDD